MRRMNLKIRLVGLAVLVCASGAGRAMSAVPAEIKTGDAQCLLLSNVFSKMGTDEKGKQAALVAHFYYLGRMNAEMTPSEIGPALADAAKRILPGLAGPAMQACVKSVQASETNLQAAAKILKPAAK